MHRRTTPAFALCASALGLCLATPAAAGDDPRAGARPVAEVAQRTAITRPMTPGREIAYEETRPDVGMIGAGVMVLGSSYIASIIVASRSGHEGDRQLYVPVAGPWLDLAKRPSCPSDRADCSGETTNKVLLVSDGVLQALGVLQIFGGFAFPEKKIVTHSATVRVRPAVSPTQVGLAASGTF
jgi:hypothetical protein